MNFKKSDFGPDFWWGVATAAAQIEGAYNEDGRTPSIWDEFAAINGGKNIKTREHAKEACNHYHLYKEDVALLSDLNFKNYRFSTSWSRLYPNGHGAKNPKGFDFYDRLIDSCLEKNITPWLTLYHWDLPLCLHYQGGWANRDILRWFAEYADGVTRAFGDRVKHWMVLNEPTAFVGLGYFAGLHAPGKRNPISFLKALHHATLSQGLGGRIVRQNVADALVGTTYSCAPTEGHDPVRDANTQRRFDAILNRIFIEPVLGMRYPVAAFSLLRYLDNFRLQDDERDVIFDFDFIGLQNYTRTVVRHSYSSPLVWGREVLAEHRQVPPEKRTLMGWEVYPEGLYKVLKQFSAYKNIPPLIISENGAAFKDTLTPTGQVHDHQRTQFFKDYLAQMLRAKQEGVDVRGYFVWTFMDNFEWAEGYTPRFGLVYNDFETQKRYPKDSALWFKSFLGE